jgi:hypothetical protein
VTGARVNRPVKGLWCQPGGQKAVCGKVRLILPKKIGEVVITKEWREGRLRKVQG